LKVLIADDNEKRAVSIKNLLIAEKSIQKEDILIRDCSSAALSLMRRQHFDILILDVVLPYLDEDASCQNSYDLLESITKNASYKKPRKIIGITAHIDDIHTFKEEFDAYCFALIEASNNNPTWKGRIISSINYEIESEISRSVDDEDIICLSIHGIRTNGGWQQGLKRLIHSKVGEIQYENFKFGKFDVVSFFIPFFRHWVVARFGKDLEKIIDDNPNKKIYIFSHSFGTYVAVKAIENLIKRKSITNISKIVLSGSVLKSNYNFDKILKQTNAKIVNDCGDRDLILVLSELFVPNTGMAGRTGFHGLNNNSFANRFFVGGHSHYFTDKSKFMENHWIPLFSDYTDIEVIDQRPESNYINDLIDMVSSFLGKFKELIYCSIFTYYIYSLFS
jgi:CheY-like chemotaxis protein